IAFPGVPGGIQWRVTLSIPHVDLFKQTSPLPPELTLGPGMFSVELGVQLCLDCRRLKIDPRPPRDTRGDKNREGKEDGRRDDRHPRAELTCCRLKVFAVGHIEHVLSSTGEDAVALAVDGVEIVDIKPDEVESVLE